MMDDIRCTGDETHIGACKFSGWGKHNCGHDEDVSISCGKQVVLYLILQKMQSKQIISTSPANK